MHTLHKILNTGFVLRDEVVWIPAGAGDRLVIIQVWLSPVVLPIMCVYALASVVFDVIKRTPESLVVKDKEIDVLLVVMDQLHANFILSVCKRTVITVLAVDTILWVMSAKLGFVLIWTVQLLNFIMAERAIIPVLANEVVLVIFYVLD